MLIHSEDFPHACPNAPNCPKVSSYFVVPIPFIQVFNNSKYFLWQRFKQKGGSKRHFANCRAEKPTVCNNQEDDSESNHSSVHVKRNFGPLRRITQPAQQSNQSKIIWKDCTVSIKRTDFIERAIWLGYSSLTRVSHLDKRKGKQVGKWVNTAQIGAGTGPKKRKT